ncbi:MAG: hypothetical protein COY09_03140 [Candidatus Portnoybacteria bacterium CG_4_10_14_0_2_um_filter_39_11]|uniref:GIY-YIG domain-containing protein n=2 Tax=Parcubacteria group TaxID=1794811 RepID=A0A2M7UGP9_9BACT|nr:MAG: hypothetical protein COY09_03140 [Candidatus Portnoybacteria bacterium CG_4_10_14_0_2_um_filter_39_11]
MGLPLTFFNMYYFYLLQSIKKSSEIYTESTNNLKYRFSEHNQGKVFSTKRHLPWKLIYYETYLPEKDARLREQKFKRHGKGNQEMKKRLENSLGIFGESKDIKKGEGFTLIEFLIVFLIFAILIILILSGFRSFQAQTGLDKNIQSSTQLLRLARNYAISSKNNQPYGVHIENGQIVLFEGTTYTAANTSNQGINLTNGVAIDQINLNPTSSTTEIIFEKTTGTTANDGYIRLSQTNDPSQNQLIYIEPSGQIDLISGPIATTSRQIDSRHIHVILTRPILTASEKIYLYFDNATTSQQTIDIATNLSGGQIDWSGTVSINGQDQQIRLHTHGLNDPNTIFCIHRDRRFNNKSLKINVESDNLINYAADGTLSNGLSIWAQPPQIQ